MKFNNHFLTSTSANVEKFSFLPVQVYFMANSISSMAPMGICQTVQEVEQLENLFSSFLA